MSRPGMRNGYVGIAIVLLAVLVADIGSAHTTAPTVTAQHAFVGDSLMGLDTADGSLFTILPDEQTAQASTTKIMTLHLAILALRDGVVGLDDEVTVSATAASIGGSTMADTSGTPLEEGEVVTLEALFRGMMYPSGNNAAWAIAEHVAQGYLGAAADSDEFVAMMNQHAADEGLVDTHFANPNGFDDPDHYTTARELAKLWDHAADEDPYFLAVTGFQGTYSATTQGPNGPKMYSWGWGFSYPGWEGAKGGGTTNCNGPNGGCMIMSASRMGRRVVVSFMQGLPWTEEPALFDYGYSQIFHPDLRAVGAASPPTSRYSMACDANGGRAIVGSIGKAGSARLDVWSVDADGASISKLGQADVPGTGMNIKGQGQGKGAERDITVMRMPYGEILVAYRKASTIELSSWTLNWLGQPVLTAQAKATPGREVDMVSLSDKNFLVATRTDEGALRLSSWNLDPVTGLTQLDSHVDESRVYEELSLAKPDHVDFWNGHRAVLATQTADNLFIHQVWGADATTGELTMLGELEEEGLGRTRIALSALPAPALDEDEIFPPTYYATGFVSSGDEWVVRFYRIATNGVPVFEGTTAGLGSSAAQVRVAGVSPGGVLVASRDANGNMQLDVLEAKRESDNDITPDILSTHEPPDAANLELCGLFDANAHGDYVTATEAQADDGVVLRVYRVGDRP